MDHSYDIADVVIANGETTSREISREEIRFAKGFVFYAPGTLPETVTIEVSPDEGENFFTLQSSGEDIQLPAGKATVVKYMGWDRMRLAADSAVGDDRTFQIEGQESLR